MSQRKFPGPHPPCRILYVDDERLSLKYFREIVGEEFDVVTAPSAEEGLDLIQQEPESIAIVVSDQRLGGMQGTAFLSLLREKHPRMVRILATAYSDVATAVSAINNGAIYHYISKPWDPNSLLPTLRCAIESYLLRTERERLLGEKAAMVRNLIVSDRLAGYGVLAQGINHHLRNLLVPVEVYLQLASGSDENFDPPADPGLMEDLRQAAHTQMRRIIGMLDRLSAIQKPNGSARHERVAVETLWREALSQLTAAIEERNAAVTLHAPEPLPPIHCNRSRVTHLLRLLLEDELERIDPAGRIDITLELRPPGSDLPEHIRMEVTDGGPAVESERLASIFTPFFVRPESPQYYGINLATAYVMLCSLGGWAHAYNDASRGTVIVLCLPTQFSERPSFAPPLEAWEQAMGLARA